MLAAYAEWGPQAVERFNGMFAFAIWDRRKRELFLARDRYGIKPLYYADVGGCIVFGSEVKSLLEHPALSARVSLPHLLEYFTFQNIFTDGTLFEGVKMLPAGAHDDARRADSARPEARAVLGLRRSSSPRTWRSEEEYQEELDRLLRQAVERQLVVGRAGRRTAQRREWTRGASPRWPAAACPT